MSVNTFDPNALKNLSRPIDAELLSEIVEIAVAANADIEQMNLSQVQIDRIATVAQHDGWQEAAGDLDDRVIAAVIRLFTLGEMRYSSWKADSKSPVVALARILKKRQTLPVDLVIWIKANTNNQFLPHGDLMDLL